MENNIFKFGFLEPPQTIFSEALIGIKDNQEHKKSTNYEKETTETIRRETKPHILHILNYQTHMIKELWPPHKKLKISAENRILWTIN